MLQNFRLALFLIDGWKWLLYLTALKAEDCRSIDGFINSIRGAFRLRKETNGAGDGGLFFESIELDVTVQHFISSRSSNAGIDVCGGEGAGGDLSIIYCAACSTVLENHAVRAYSCVYREEVS